MKKSKLCVAATLLAMTVAAAGCGKKDSAAETTTAAESTAETVSADDPEIQALESTEKPTAPDVADMGSITFPELSSITVSATPAETVTDEDLESQINYLLSQNMEEVSEKAKQGDTVNIDYVGTIDGEEFDGGSAEGYDLELGSGSFIDNFEDQLVGYGAGDKVTVKVTFPEDYSQESLQGKAAEFAVTVNSVKRAPELTDAWVQSYENTKADTVEAFREEQRALMQANYDNYYHSDVQQKALEALVEASDITLSDAMKQYGEDFVIYSNVQQVQNYGMSLADLINMYSMTVSEFKEEMASEGESYAEQYFVVKKLAADQGITATDEVMDALAKNLSELSGEEYTKESLIESYGQETVESEAVNEAVLSYLESQVQVTEETAESSETADAEESTEAETTEVAAEAASESQAQ